MKFELGPGVECDVQVLLRGRGLLQAMSGGGKSWAMRRILEQLVGVVQELVIDCEGDFKTLREKFPFVLVAAEGGDALASPATARPMALKLLELGVPAILDISGLGMDDQEQFVAEFLRGLMHAPQELWHDTLVVVDEAQVFCPQGRKTLSKSALTDAAPRFRKRGFGLLLATPALAQVDKRVSEMCANKLIGRSMFVDAERAARELGMPELRTEMRGLDDGEFYCFGPAISREVVKVHVGPVQTTHPSPGGRSPVAPPPPEQVMAILSELNRLVPIAPPPPEVSQQPDSSAEKAKPCGHEKELHALRNKVAVLEHDLVQGREYGQQALRERDDWKGRHAAAASELAAFADLKRAFAAILGGGEGVAMAAVDEDALVARVLAQVGRNGGSAQVTIAAPDALRKKYLQEAADRLYEKLQAVGADARIAIEYLLGQDKFVAITRIAVALSGSDGGGQRARWQRGLQELMRAGVVIKGGGGRTQYRADIAGAVAGALASHDAKPDELSAVEQQVLYRLAKAGVGATA